MDSKEISMDITEMSTTDKVLAGIDIIRKYQPDADFAAEHDIIYFGDHESSETMTIEDKCKLDDLGWIEEYESWARFV